MTITSFAGGTMISAAGEAVGFYSLAQSILANVEKQDYDMEILENEVAEIPAS